MLIRISSNNRKKLGTQLATETVFDHFHSVSVPPGSGLHSSARRRTRRRAGAAQTACHTSQVLSRLRHESARVRPCLEALLSPRLALKCKPRVASVLPGSEELLPS